MKSPYHIHWIRGLMQFLGLEQISFTFTCICTDEFYQTWQPFIVKEFWAKWHAFTNYLDTTHAEHMVVTCNDFLCCVCLLASGQEGEQFKTLNMSNYVPGTSLSCLSCTVSHFVYVQKVQINCLKKKNNQSACTSAFTTDGSASALQPPRPSAL